MKLIATPRNAFFVKSKAFALLFCIFEVVANLTAQNPCKPDIVGIWEEEQDMLSALLAEEKVYKFYEGDKVEIYQYSSEIEDFVLLGNGDYKIDNQTTTSKIVFSNLTVLFFQTEGSFAFPILKFENSVLEWQGMFGITTRLLKVDVPLYDVPLISQENTQICWAASAAMMYSWKKQKKYSVAETLIENSMGDYLRYKVSGEIDLVWLMKFFGRNSQDPENDKLHFGGLPSSLLDKFYVKKMGLIKVNYTPTIKGLQELLLNYGPLLVLLDNNLANSDAYYHARIINGISGDGTNQCTFLNILDPWPFKGYEQIRTESYEDFKNKIYKTYMENEPDKPENFRIYHW